MIDSSIGWRKVSNPPGRISRRLPSTSGKKRWRYWKPHWDQKRHSEILKSYFRYYHESRTHLSLDKDAPESRPIQSNGMGRIVGISQVGGLHHRYERRAA